MANTILYTFSLCVLLSAVYSKPVAHDSKSVQSSNSELTENTVKLDTETVVTYNLESARETELVQVHSAPSLDAPSLTDSVKRRVKRQVIVGHGCADGTIWFKRKCMLFETYEQLLREDELEK